MHDTGFTVLAEKLDRLASAYMAMPGQAKVTFFDDARAYQKAKDAAGPNAASRACSKSA